MGLMIFLPLPLGNVLPNMSLELLSLGWMFHDGLVLLASAMVGSGAVAFAAALGHLVWEALAVAHGWWGWTSPLPMGRSGSTPAGTRLGPPGSNNTPAADRPSAGICSTPDRPSVETPRTGGSSSHT